jgi:hypothetical protein
VADFTSIPIDESEDVMSGYFKRRAARRLATVEFCESCGSVCDARCRAERQRELHRLNAGLLAGRW